MPNPLKQTSSLLSRKESQEPLHFCQHGFNWRRSVEPDLDGIQRSAGTPPTPFWKRPPLFFHFQPASCPPPPAEFLTRVQQPIETSIFGQSRLQPARRPRRFPKTRTAELSAAESARRRRPGMRPPTSCVKGFIFHSVFRRPHSPRRLRECAPEPPPTPGNLPAG